MSISIEKAIIREMLQIVCNEDPDREGLRDTPSRVTAAWDHWCSGYDVDIPELLKTFEDGANGYDEMVVRKGIPVYSHCEHHMAAIFGTATVAYIPNGKIVGLSKMDRLVDAFARRLQVQERMTNQIADAMMEHLKPLGVGVWMSCRHLCIESRGVQNMDSTTITTSLRGVFLDKPEVRSEFLAAARC
jgi:GTP cyclohydrolase IA